jgi:hypothetical protein
VITTSPVFDDHFAEHVQSCCDYEFEVTINATEDFGSDFENKLLLFECPAVDFAENVSKHLKLKQQIPFLSSGLVVPKQ